jgi:hypothetical protein
MHKTLLWLKLRVSVLEFYYYRHKNDEISRELAENFHVKA